MTLQECQKRTVILNEKQCAKIKGGTDGSDTSDFAIIEDIDSF